jgi:hypothetical protein
MQVSCAIPGTVAKKKLTGHENPHATIALLGCPGKISAKEANGLDGGAVYPATAFAPMLTAVKPLTMIQTASKYGDRMSDGVLVLAWVIGSTA